MFEKLLLAATITFSLNLFIQVRAPEQNQTGTSYQQQPQISSTILVTRPDK